MFIPFLYALRARKVPVGTVEALALARALTLGLHDSALSGFYDVARALLVHDEKHLDAFDQAFKATFEGVEADALAITEQLLSWLKATPGALEGLSTAELEALSQLDLAELERQFAERLAEQRRRHEGGERMVGTRGSSPFGNTARGQRPGIRVAGEGGQRSAVRVATERLFKDYRDDLLLDVRQLSMALRKLRLFTREGQHDELDLERTIDETARNLGELTVAVRPPRRSNTRVILLMDVGGSMDPFAHLVSRLFTAARQATHFRELRTLYFHNCVYGRVYRSARFTDPVSLAELFAETDRRYKLIVVGDALMAPWELFSVSGWADEADVDGLQWLLRLREHYPAAAWLNPEPPQSWWQQTIEVIRKVYPMYPLTLEGLSEAVQSLTRVR